MNEEVNIGLNLKVKTDEVKQAASALIGVKLAAEEMAKVTVTNGAVTDARQLALVTAMAQSVAGSLAAVERIATTLADLIAPNLSIVSPERLESVSKEAEAAAGGLAGLAEAAEKAGQAKPDEDGLLKPEKLRDVEAEAAAAEAAMALMGETAEEAAGVEPDAGGLLKPETLRDVEAEAAAAEARMRRMEEAAEKASGVKPKPDSIWTRKIEIDKALGLGTGIALAQKAFGALSNEIQYVIQNIDDIPGIPERTRESVRQLGEDMGEIRRGFQQLVAWSAAAFSQTGQGLGYGAAMLMYGTDAAAEAMAKDLRAREAVRGAAEREKNEARAAAEEKREEERATAELNAALEQLARTKQFGETPTERRDRLLAEAAAMRQQAEKAEPLQALTLMTRAQMNEVEAEKIYNAMVKERMNIMAAINTENLTRLPLIEQEVALQERLAELAGKSGETYEEDTAILQEYTRIQQALLAVQAALASEAAVAMESQRQAKELLLGMELEQIRYERELLANQPETERGRRRMAELVDEERKALLKLAEAAREYAKELPEGSAEQLAALSRAQGFEQSSGRVGLGQVPQQSRIEGARAGYAGLDDPAQHYQGAGEGIEGGALEYMTQVGTVGDQVNRVFTTTAQTMTQSMGSAFADMILQAEDFKSAMQGFFMEVGQAFVRAAAQMVAEQIMSLTVMKAVRSIFNAQEVAEEGAKTAATTAIHTTGEATKTGATLGGAVARGAIRLGETVAAIASTAWQVTTYIAGQIAMTAVAVAQGAIRIAATIAQAIPNIILAGVQALASLSMIPIVGPVLGIAAMGAVVAAGMALLGGFAEGGYTGTGGRTEPAGIVHKGEWVAPKWMVESPQYGPLIASMEGARTGRGYEIGGFVAPSPLTKAPTLGGAGAGGGGYGAAGQETRIIRGIVVDSMSLAERLSQEPGVESVILDISRRNFDKLV